MYCLTLICYGRRKKSNYFSGMAGLKIRKTIQLNFLVAGPLFYAKKSYKMWPLSLRWGGG